MGKSRVETTLFMFSSVDGKISTGDVDERDVDNDFPRIKGIKEGLYQYYDLQKHTDYWSMNSGRVMAKIGINERKGTPAKIKKLRFVIIDNKPHLQKNGIKYLTKMLKTLYIVTANKNHPAFELKKLIKNLEIINYSGRIDFEDLFVRLRQDYGADRMTIQSGGTLNSILLRKKLIDHISVVVAPALIGGKDTPTLIDGISLRTERDLVHIKALRLRKCKKLKHSYVHLVYDVINETKVARS